VKAPGLGSSEEPRSSMGDEVRLFKGKKLHRRIEPFLSAAIGLSDRLVY